MTRYPNSECDAHRNVRSSEPVCIICMENEIRRLREFKEFVVNNTFQINGDAVSELKSLPMRGCTLGLCLDCFLLKRFK